MPIQDTDLFLVSRGGKNYKATGEEVKDYAGDAGEANPTPGNTSVIPPFAGGDGTQGNPFVCTPASVNIGGVVQSAQLITFSGLRAGQRVVFQDLNSATNGNRFSQPTGIVTGNGSYSFRLQFRDAPSTPSGGSYTASIKCGTTTVYFRWQVTVLTSGVETPSILELQNTRGDFFAAPTEPSYLTQTTVGGLSPVAPITGLSPNETTPEISINGGTGSGATVKISSTEEGGLGFVDIVTKGLGYSFGDSVSVDLSSIGGSSSTPFTVNTDPVTGGAATFKVTEPVIYNAGSFALSEWQFSTNPSFQPAIETTLNANSAVVTVPVGLPGNTVYYCRFRYKTSTDVYSEYSPTIRSATSSLVEIEYIFKSFPESGFDGKSFDSNAFYVTPKPYSYLVAIDNSSPLVPAGLDGGGDGGVSSGPGGARGAAGRAAIYIQLRQPIQFLVTQVGQNNGVANVTNTNVAYGLNDYYVRSNAAPTTGGSGTGCTIFLDRDLSGRTIFFSLGSPGQGYSVGDVLTVTPPIGNGTNKANRTTNVTGFSVGTMDSYWDVLIHGAGNVGGIAGGGSAGGASGGYLTSNGGVGGTGISGGGAGGAGGIVAYSVAIGNGGNGQSAPTTNLPCGGGGGSGWGAGAGGKAAPPGDASKPGGGGGGGATFLNTQFVTNGAVTPTTYPTPGVDVYVNGFYRGTANSNIFIYRLA